MGTVGKDDVSVDAIALSAFAMISAADFYAVRAVVFFDFLNAVALANVAVACSGNCSLGFCCCEGLGCECWC